MRRASAVVLGSAIALALAAAAGCKAAVDYPDRVGGGGGGGGGGNQHPDAGAPSDGGADAPAGALTGVVCVVTDLRAPTTCAAGDLTGVVVTDLASGTATTAAADGSFALDLGAATRATLEVGVGDGALVPGVVSVPIDGTPVIAPVPRLAELADLEDALGVNVPDGDGAVALYVLDAGGAGVAGYVVTPPSGTLYPPFYDDGAAVAGWSSGGATGPVGGALIFGVAAGAADLSASADGGTTNVDVSAIPVVDAHVTFVTAAAP